MPTYLRMKPFPGFDRGSVVVLNDDKTVDLGPQIAVSETMRAVEEPKVGTAFRVRGDKSGGVMQTGVVAVFEPFEPEDFRKLKEDYARHEKEFLAKPHPELAVLDTKCRRMVSQGKMKG